MATVVAAPSATSPVAARAAARLRRRRQGDTIRRAAGRACATRCACMPDPWGRGSARRSRFRAALRTSGAHEPPSGACAHHLRRSGSSPPPLTSAGRAPAPCSPGVELDRRLPRAGSAPSVHVVRIRRACVRASCVRASIASTGPRAARLDAGRRAPRTAHDHSGRHALFLLMPHSQKPHETAQKQAICKQTA